MGIIANYKSVTLDELKKLQHGELNTWHFLHHNDEYLCIEKTWNLIKYILTGATPPTGNVLDNVMPISFENTVNDEDMGMGPASYIDNATVKEMSIEFEKFTEEVFKSNIDAQKMIADEVYPIFEGETNETIFEYAYPYFEMLKEYFKKASMEDKYIVLWLSWFLGSE